MPIALGSGTTAEVVFLFLDAFLHIPIALKWCVLMIIIKNVFLI